MEVILKSVYCSPKGTYQAGTPIEVDELEGQQLVSGGYTISAKPSPPPKPEPVIETAEPVIETEKATVKTRKRK